MADSTTYNKAFKILYTDEDVVDAMLKDEQMPLLGMIAKDDKLCGIQFDHPIEYATNESTSATYAAVAAIDGSAQFQKWSITAKEWYGRAVWTQKAVEESRLKQGAFKNIVTNEMESVLRTLRRDFERQFWGPLGGAIGQIKVDASYPVTGATIKLVDKWTAIYFQPGMAVDASANDGTSGAIRVVADATKRVTAVDPINGLITLDANWNAVLTAVAQGDYLFKRGAFGTAANMYPFRGWVPVGTPVTHHGIDCTLSPVQFGGVRITASSGSLKETILNALSEGSVYGAHPDKGFLHPMRMGELVNELEAESMRPRDVTGKSQGGTAEFGFKGIAVQGPGKVIELYPAPLMSYYDIALLDMSTWKLRSMNKFPSVMSNDGLQFCRQYNAMGYEARLYAYGEYCCTCPGRNIGIRLT